jgi:hypothetical protein
MWFVALQVALGIAIVMIVLNMSLWVSRRDRLVPDGRLGMEMEKEVAIIDGYAMSSFVSRKTWTTVNPYSKHYLPLKRSYNRKGGAQFSYSFWMQLEDTSSENVANKIILLRGDTKQYTYTRTRKIHSDLDMLQGTLDANAATQSVDKTTELIKCPLIRFGDTYDTIVVEFNTIHDPDHTIVVRPRNTVASDPQYDDTTLRKNLVKLGQNKWVMYTFTFQDNVAINDFEDGIIMRCFVNDVLYHSATVKSTLRLNLGNLYVMPPRDGASGDANIQLAKIGNLNYYNYALSVKMVADLYKRGHPKYLARDIMGREGDGDPMYLSEYNKLDIYNT